MRTTVNLDDDVLRLADQLAESRAISRGEAISELARRGVRQTRQALPIKLRNGFAVLDVGAAETFSSDDVTAALSREDTNQARLHR
jgi:metal-responsive CopG/Arc/MetJ family transcriptional regulator